MKFARSLVAMLAFAIPALAFAFDSYRFGEKLVTVGDSAAKLSDLAGQPVYKQPIENDKGALEGERWQYRIDGKTVTFTIRDSHVSEIQESRD
ncbi:MAG: DUF2845 domain-containing protein [Dokdonella sp.]